MSRMYTLVLALASIAAISHCSPPHHFGHSMMPFPGHFPGFHGPPPPFFFGGPHELGPRRIIILRPPPGSHLPFLDGPPRRMLRPLPSDFLPRRPRPMPFRPSGSSRSLPQDIDARTLHDISKYGYRRPDFHRKDSPRFDTRTANDNYRRPYRRNLYPAFDRRRTGDRYLDAPRDFRRDSFRSDRGRNDRFSGDQLGIRRRFDSRSAIRSAIPSRTRGSMMNDRANDRRRSRENRIISMRANSDWRGDPRTNVAMKQSDIRRPLLEQAAQSISDVVEQKPGVPNDNINGGRGGGLDGLIDLSHVEIPREALPPLQNGPSLDLFDKVIDLTSLEGQRDIPPPSQIMDAVMETVQTAMKQPDAKEKPPKEALQPQQPPLEPTKVPDVAPEVPPKLESLSPPSSVAAEIAGDAGVTGHDHALPGDPLAPSVSILDLGPDGPGTIPSGGDLSGLGNVDVLTLSNEGFAALEKAIQSGQAISADVLDSIIGAGGGTATGQTGSSSLGANIVVIDHPSAGHSAAGHADHTVDLSSGHPNMAAAIARATNVLPHGHSSHGNQGSHGTHGQDAAPVEAVGTVGEPVGAVDASGASDVMGIFTVPSASSGFPEVPKSVSTIPKSIGKRLNAIKSDHGTHAVH